MRIAIKKSLLVSQLSKENLLNLPSLPMLCTDSRMIKAGDIFMALSGENFNGHDFINNALENGASLIIAEEKFKNHLATHDKTIFVVGCIKFLGELARCHLQQFDLTKIAITGSNGKTTTKEMIKAALSHVLGEEAIFATEGNQNNHIGVPFNALAVKETHKVAIFEMGMNHSGEISELCKIVKPNIGLITNIGRAHEGNFSDGILGVQKAKGELFLSIAENQGIAIVNKDDPRILAEADKNNLTNRLAFGFSPLADIIITSCKQDKNGMQKVTLTTPKEPLVFDIPLLGEHNACNAAAALSVVFSLNLPLYKAALGLMYLKKNKGRFFIKNHKGYLVIDDGYNANPDSMAAGIRASKEFLSKRRIAVIGSMGELGIKSEEYHRELGQLLAHNFQYLYFCGHDCQSALTGALNEGFPATKVFYQNTSVELIEPLKAMVKEGDLVFIKGSLSANMEVVTKALLAAF